MGKRYADEMETLPTVHDWALREATPSLEEFVDMSWKLPLCAVGSGGSLAAAALAAMLHRYTGNVAVYDTPVALWRGPPLSGCARLLVSANGRNAEILNARRVEAVPPIGVVCASAKNPLTESCVPGMCVHARTPPTGRDGFLATNTLLATCVWLAKAYGSRMPDLDYTLRWSDLMGPGFADATKRHAARIYGKRHVLVLADEWSWPAAVDAESRFHESGLASAQITDWRNFAHGRHNWLAVNGAETAVVALVTGHSDDLADSTLELLPDHIPVARLDARHSHSTGTLELLVQVMRLVGDLGAMHGIDPGRPKVAEFGRRIHELDCGPAMRCCKSAWRVP